jgi:predicted  nucleic acid-binding Zn-ribbon protein
MRLKVLANHTKGARNMSRLALASERFNAALDSLVRALQPLLEARKSSRYADARVATLNEEREKLLVRIAELEDEARALSGTTEEVENRLDSAVAEIRSALGR